MSESNISYNYGTFSICFHLTFFIFLIWNRHFNKNNLQIPVKYLKIMGAIGVITGLIFYIYGDQLINQ